MRRPESGFDRDDPAVADHDGMRSHRRLTRIGEHMPGVDDDRGRRFRRFRRLGRGGEGDGQQDQQRSPDYRGCHAISRVVADSQCLAGTALDCAMRSFPLVQACESIRLPATAVARCGFQRKWRDEAQVSGITYRDGAGLRCPQALQVRCSLEE